MGIAAAFVETEPAVTSSLPFHLKPEQAENANSNKKNRIPDAILAFMKRLQWLHMRNIVAYLTTTASICKHI